MTIDAVRGLLLWSAILNYGFLLAWIALYLFARGPMRSVARWYRLSAEDNDRIQFSGILLYKLGIWFFNLIPYLVLRIVG